MLWMGAARSTYPCSPYPMVQQGQVCLVPQVTALFDCLLAVVHGPSLQLPRWYWLDVLVGLGRSRNDEWEGAAWRCMIVRRCYCEVYLGELEVGLGKCEYASIVCPT
jgi:hypothetical protein